jgi:hypothetical protein
VETISTLESMLLGMEHLPQINSNLKRLSLEIELQNILTSWIVIDLKSDLFRSVSIKLITYNKGCVSENKDEPVKIHMKGFSKI